MKVIYVATTVAYKSDKQTNRKDKDLTAKTKDLPLRLTLNHQGQGQGLKICPRGQLQAKDQGQGQQHWLDALPVKWRNTS